MRAFILVLLTGIFLSGNAAAEWSVFEGEDGRTWDCDGRYCYSDGVSREQIEFDNWLNNDDGLGGKMTGDPLAMPKPKANKKAAANSKSNTDKDPLAMPAKKQNRNDPLAF